MQKDKKALYRYLIIAALLALAGAFVIFNNKPTAKSDEAENPSKKSPDIQIEIDNTEKIEEVVKNELEKIDKNNINI